MLTVQNEQHRYYYLLFLFPSSYCLLHSNLFSSKDSRFSRFFHSYLNLPILYLFSFFLLFSSFPFVIKHFRFSAVQVLSLSINSLLITIPSSVLLVTSSLAHPFLWQYSLLLLFNCVNPIFVHITTVLVAIFYLSLVALFHISFLSFSPPISSFTCLSQPRLENELLKHDDQLSKPKKLFLSLAIKSDLFS